jgi:hypothetical protein
VAPATERHKQQLAAKAIQTKGGAAGLVLCASAVSGNGETEVVLWPGSRLGDEPSATIFAMVVVVTVILVVVTGILEVSWPGA